MKELHFNFVAVCTLVLVSLLHCPLVAEGQTNSQLFVYGKHFPQGDSAVKYVYSAEGTWKKLSNLNYQWNYYEQWATANHPFDKSALIRAADGSAMYTARDADGYLLCDYNRDLEVTDDLASTSSPCSQGSAFHEHSGRGVDGSKRGNPFTQFWLDDNWLAQYMSLAYERPVPVGLVNQPGKFMRWKPIGGDVANWRPYNSNHFDTLALDGLYYLAQNRVGDAMQKWESSRGLSGATYDAQNQQFQYPGIRENYHMAMWKILTDMILTQSNQLSTANQDLLLQHSVSLRSQILNNQQKIQGHNEYPYIGWVSTIGDSNSLMNTEGISCGTLALGADAKYFYEADRLPMRVGEESLGRKYFLRPYHVVSAVVGLSPEGIMSFGPYNQFKAGSYIATFLLRTSLPLDDIARLSVYDSRHGTDLANKVVMARDFFGRDKWARVSVSFQVQNEDNSLEFRTYFTHISNLDIAGVKIN